MTHPHPGGMAVQQLVSNESLDPLERKFAAIHSLSTFVRCLQQFAGSALVLLLLATVIVIILETSGIYSASVEANSLLNGRNILDATWYTLVLLFSLLLLGGIKRASFIAGLFWFVVAYSYFRLATQLWTFFIARWGGGLLIDNTSNASRDVTFGYVAVLVIIGWIHLLAIDFSMWRGGVAAISSGNAERAALRETPSGARFPRNAVSVLWGLPPLTQFARRPRARYAAIVSLSILSSLFLSAASLAMLAAPAAVPFVAVVIVSSLRLSGLLVDGVATALSIGFVVTVIFAFSWLGRLIESTVIGLVRMSLEKLQEVDHRQPVLFLRAFRDDQVNMNNGRVPYFIRLLEFGRRRSNLDQMLLEEATPYGPLVGLGSPHDKTPPYGAARGYFEDKSWQQAVESLVRESSVTILCVDETEGVWWEVEHLAATKEVQKTLFLVHPSHRALSDNQELLARLIAKLELDGAQTEQLLAQRPDARGRIKTTVLGFFVDQDGQLQILRSSTFSRFAFLLAIHIFMREKLGMPQMVTGNPAPRTVAAANALTEAAPPPAGSVDVA